MHGKTTSHAKHAGGKLAELQNSTGCTTSIKIHSVNTPQKSNVRVAKEKYNSRSNVVDDLSKNLDKLELRRVE